MGWRSAGRHGGNSVEWEAFLAGLSVHDRVRANCLAVRYGRESARRWVRYHLVRSLDDLRNALRRDRSKVRTQVPRLYESIDVNVCPNGWRIQNVRQREATGTEVVKSDVRSPNGATGVFERGYNLADQRIELRNAFLRHSGMTDRLPTWVTGTPVPMVANRGTPTVQYFTLYQLKLLGVPDGHGAQAAVTSFKMSTIQNLESIVHLHWLRQQYPASALSDLVVHTESVDYAETTAVQCGYRLIAVRYIPAGEWESEIGDMLVHFEAGNSQRRSEHDELLARYSVDRQTVMKQNYDIELSVEPS